MEEGRGLGDFQVCGFADWSMVLPSNWFLVFSLHCTFFLDGCGISHLSCHYLLIHRKKSRMLT